MAKVYGSGTSSKMPDRYVLRVNSQMGLRRGTISTPRSPAAGRPAAGVLDVEHDLPPVGTQPGLAGREVVHLDEERVAPLHRTPHPGEEIITPPGRPDEPQRERPAPRHSGVVALLDQGVESERRPPQLGEQRPGAAPVAGGRRKAPAEGTAPTDPEKGQAAASRSEDAQEQAARHRQSLGSGPVDAGVPGGHERYL